MTEYKESQIIKHALMYYMKRPGASNKEISQEATVLGKYVKKTEMLKEKYRINTKE